MAEYSGYSNTDWARSVATTIADHIREEESSWMKSFQLGALLESHGRITYNHAGRGFDWPVEYRAHVLHGNNGETARNFARRNKWKTAALPYRGYQVEDAIYKKELLENRGEAAIVKLWDDFLGRLEKSIKHGVGPEFYVDGNATGNENSWHGFESMFQTNGTVTITTGAQRSANAGDWVGYPNDTYATLSTVLGGSGGENASGSVWPEATCDPEFDFWSPLIVNYTSTLFGGAADTWAGQGDEAMRFMIIHSQRNSSVDGQMTNIFLNRSRYFEFLNLIDGKEQINITSENELRALGFKNTVVFDGVTVSWETGVPNTSPHEDATRAMAGYGFNFNNIELRCMEDTMFKSDDVVYDIDTQSFKAAVGTLSNLKFTSPRNFGKLVSLA